MLGVWILRGRAKSELPGWETALVMVLMMVMMGTGYMVGDGARVCNGSETGQK